MIEHNKYLCDCKAVKVFEVKKAVIEYGAVSLLDVQNLTKASTGCGKCKNAVMSVIEKELKRNELKGKQLRLDF